MSEPPITPVYPSNAQDRGPEVRGLPARSRISIRQFLQVAPRFQPVATYVILALNGIAFLMLVMADASSHPPLGTFLRRTLTGIDANPQLLLNFGAADPAAFHRGEYWRLVMPMFLHIGLLHLLINSYALYVLGLLLEGVYGYPRFATLYVGSGITSAFVSMTRSHQISAGASGAIMGIAGAMLVTGYLHPWAVPRHWQRAFGRGIIPSIVLTLWLGWMLDFIDNWGHIGGLVGGILLALVILPPRQAASDVRTGLPSPGIVIVPIVVVALALASVATHYRTARELARLLDEGDRLAAAKRADKALDRYREAERLAPRDERPHEGLGMLYLQQGRLPDAVREFERALQLNRESVRAQLGLAGVYEHQGDRARAQRHLRAALGANPENAEGQKDLGDIFAGVKLYPQAIEHYEEALRRDPKLAVAHNNLAWLLATCDDPRFRNPSEALSHAQQAVRLTQWKEPNFIDTLAEAFFVNNSFGEAVRTQSKALKLAPDNREFQEHMEKYRKAAGSSYTLQVPARNRTAASGGFPARPTPAV